MEEYRSSGYGDEDGRMEAEVYGGRPPHPPPAPTGFHHHSTITTSQHTQQPQKEGRRKKHKGGGGGGGGHGSSTSNGGGWSLSDPEMQRKKRVACYKVYAVEGRMKGSLRKSLRWIKDRCSQLVYGW